eukprot:jgi/Chlat1/1437/Chrsp12S01993
MLGGGGGGGGAGGGGGGGGGEDNAHVSFESLTVATVSDLKRLNTAIFPVNYQARFFSEALAAGDFSQLAFVEHPLGRECTGAIACRLERRKDSDKARLYIMTLGVYAEYRGQRIGTRLLSNCLELCKEDPNIEDAYLHVQTNNEEAITFYKKFGFAIADLIRNYYKRIEPPDCYVLSKSLVQH